ncbi:MAG TPA: helix-turn-helix domain-containing protein [Nitrososphaerales archaeon]|nr:helix-turn-helix domain-containing protein [Nitrososphaerales archaeon]
MELFEVRFRLEHDCPYTRFTKANPSVGVLHWCSRESDVLEFTHPGVDPKEMGRRLRTLENELGSKYVRTVDLGTSRTLIVQKHNYSSMKQNVNSVIEEHNCMEVQPTVYKDGYEWYRILAFKHPDLVRLLGALSRWAEVEIVSKEKLSEGSARDTTTVSMRSLLGGLTRKQLDALLVALSAGYYDSPRRTRTADIAKLVRAPRTTYETHLRKAEGKVLRALLPYIELVSRAANESE